MKMHLTEKILHFPMLWLLLLMATTVLSCNHGNMSNDVIVENEDYTVTAATTTLTLTSVATRQRSKPLSPTASRPKPLTTLHRVPMCE